MKSIKWVIVLVVLAAVVAGGYGVYSRLTPGPAKAAGEETTPVRKGNLMVTAAAFGSISFPQKVKLSFPAAGILTELGVGVGDQVAQGQVLARMDEGPLRQAVLQAQVALTNAELALKKAKEPYSPEDMAKQEAAVAEAQRALEMARRDLTLTQITTERSVADAQQALDNAKDAVAQAQRALEMARRDLTLTQMTTERSVADAQETASQAKTAVAEAQRALEIAQQEVPVVRTTGERTVADAQEALDTELESYRAVMLRYIGRELTDEELLVDPRAYFFWVSELPQPLTDAYSALVKVKEKLDLARLQADKSLQAAQSAVTRAEETLRQAQANLGQVEAGQGVELARLQAEKSLLSAESGVARAEETLRAAQANLAQVGPEPGVKLARLQADKSLLAAQGTVSRAEETLRQAKARLAEMQAGGDPDEIAARELQVSQTRLSLEEAEANLKAARLVAPFTGVVAEVRAEAGDRVAAGAPVVVLVDPSRLEVSATVDEVDVARVRVGQPATITLDAIPGERLRGQVKSISPVAQIQAGVVSYPMVISIVSGDGAPREGMTPRQGMTSRGGGTSLPPAAPGSMAAPVPPRGGMSASVEIVVEMKPDVLLVPSRAVRSMAPGTMVSVKTAQGVELRLVEVGGTDGRNTEIVSGLQEGETVVLPASASPTPRPLGGSLGGGMRMFP